MVIFIENLVKSGIDHINCASTTFFGIGKKFVHHFLNKPGDSFKTSINIAHNFFIYILVICNEETMETNFAIALSPHGLNCESIDFPIAATNSWSVPVEKISIIKVLYRLVIRSWPKV